MALASIDGNPRDGRGFHGLKVLVVEDEALIALDLEDMLSDLGCEILAGQTTVAGALELLATYQPDAVLLDFHLADGPAVPVAQALTRAGVPFALMTGHSAGQVDEEPTLRGAICLAKPFAHQALTSALAKLAMPASPA